MAKAPAERLPTFEAWTNRLKVYNDYVRALAEYKKASAEAMLKQAQAAQEWEKVRAMQLVIRQMSLELQRLQRASAQVRKEIQKSQERVQRASLLLSGKPLQGFAQAWSAYEYFERQALLESSEDLYAIKVPTHAHQAKYFLNNRDPLAECDPLPEDIETALALASWLRAKKYMTRGGTPPHQTLVQLFRAIDKVAQQEVREMQRALEEMRKGTFDAWKPSAIIGIPTKMRRPHIESRFVSRSPRMKSVPLPRKAASKG